MKNGCSVCHTTTLGDSTRIRYAGAWQHGRCHFAYIKEHPYIGPERQKMLDLAKVAGVDILDWSGATPLIADPEPPDEIGQALIASGFRALVEWHPD